MAMTKQPRHRIDTPALRKAFQAYRKHASRLRKRKGVVGVSFGLKATKGWYGFESPPHCPKPKKKKLTYAIIVLVERKLDKSVVPKRQLLPTSIDGVPVDVVEMRTGHSVSGIGLDYDSTELISGVPLGFPGSFGAGTLGLVAKAPDGQQRLVTCSHIAFGTPPSPNLGPVFQPPLGTPVAVGTPDVDGMNSNPPQDCATVTITGVKPAVAGKVLSLSKNVSGIIKRSPGIVSLALKKYGPKSGLTEGHIAIFNYPFYNPTLGRTFPKQYIIGSSTPELFCEPGDSGSLVFTEQDNELKAVAIVIGQLDDTMECVALPIEFAFKALGVKI